MSGQVVASMLQRTWEMFRGHGRARGSTAGSSGLGITGTATVEGALVFPVDSARPTPGAGRTARGVRRDA
jgi:hypothetical protein